MAGIVSSANSIRVLHGFINPALKHRGVRLIHFTKVQLTRIFGEILEGTLIRQDLIGRRANFLVDFQQILYALAEQLGGKRLWDELGRASQVARLDLFICIQC